MHTLSKPWLIGLCLIALSTTAFAEQVTVSEPVSTTAATPIDEAAPVTPPSANDDEITPQAAIAAAIAAVDAANALGHEWRDSRKLIAKAEQALAAGEESQALALALKALLQGEAAIQQAETQANAGPRF